jgi:hypothetical protein
MMGQSEARILPEEVAGLRPILTKEIGRMACLTISFQRARFIKASPDNVATEYG